MDLRRLFPTAVVLGAAALAGCVTPSKPEPTADKPTVAAPPQPAVIGGGLDQNDTVVKLRLRAFIAGDGLSLTPPKPGQAARLTAAWNNKVIYAPDPTHGGEPVPGLMGELWLFGPEIGAPMTLEGELFVGAWDNGPTATGGQPILMEVWHIDPEAARKLRQKDFFGGDGYHLFLPWSQYHVDLKQVNVVARFNGADGRCLVSTPETLTMDHSVTLQRAAEKLGGLNPNPPQAPAAAGPAAAQAPAVGPLNGK
jgi:hypothetical protein